ncbi:MBG domain-containing protein, partial [Rubrolithibacter danxiaensis]|uniref:MBG domain-containing protein n=1 Tax=Rubrolithibacter danxiaensis TaxID=3390805 RepID=UPI003BF8962D
RTYGTANPALTVSYSGFVNGDTATDLTTPPTATTAATTGSAAGTYAITAAGGASANYDFTYTAGTLTIGKATLAVTADDQSRTYGTANPALTVSYSGFVNGDTATDLTTPPTATTAATTGSAAGTYAITAAGGASANYDFTYTAGTLTIGKATLAVTADDQSKTYGTANPALTVSYSGFVNGDTATDLTTPPTATTAATTGSAAGTYAITAAGGASANYDFTYTAGTLTIGKATLAVTADDQSRTYGSANPALTVSYSGFVNGDTATDLTTPPTAITAATTGSAAGTYAITAAGGVSSNYDFTYTAGTLTIGKATLAVTADDQSRTYGSANPALTVSYSGFVNGDTATDLTTAPTATTAATTGSAAGTYAITAAGGASANYDFTYTAGTLTIGKATLAVTADDQSKTYGSANPALTVSYSGFVNGDTATDLTTPPTATTAATTGSAAGTYAIT